MNYHIDIDSYIGYPVSKQWVAAQLKAAGKGEVAVRINSYGGDVQTALDIRQQFIDHGNVTAYIFGMTASAATILAMGAKKICMSRYALMLIHRCAGWVDTWGRMNAEELAAAIRALEKTQVDLETIDGLIVAVYAQRTGQKPADIAHVMQEAAWLTAEQCKELGLVDEIIEEGEAEPVTDSVRHQFAACGLPEPPTKDSKDLKDSKDSKGFLSKVIKAIKDSKDSKKETTGKKIVMDNSKITSLLAALGIETLATNEDGTCGLTEEQLTALNDQLAAAASASAEAAALKQEAETLRAENTTLKAANDSLTEQVKALQAADGAADTDIEPESSKEMAETAAAMFDRIKGNL